MSVRTQTNLMVAVVLVIWFAQCVAMLYLLAGAFQRCW